MKGLEPPIAIIDEMISVPIDIYFKLNTCAHHCFFRHYKGEAKKMFMEQTLVPMNKFNQSSKQYKDYLDKKQKEIDQLELEF